MALRTLLFAGILLIATPATFAAASATLSEAPATLIEAPATLSEDARDEAKAQVEFGIKVAQNGLWKEATYRWEKATQIDPTYAQAWNNLAIGYEYAGRFDDAEAAYQRALKLEPGNTMIQHNYELFKELNERTKRRRDR